jgi:hypothetical protein
MSGWDVAEEQPITPAGDGWNVVEEKKRDLGGGEIAKRAGSSAFAAANAYAVAPLIGLAKLLGAPLVAERIANTVVEPNLRRVERASLQADERAGPVGGTVLAAAPELGKMVPDIAEGMGLAKAAPQAVVRAGAPVVERVIANLRSAAPVGYPAGFRRAVERDEELRAAGVDPLISAPSSAASGAMTVGQFALPASAGSQAASLAGRVISRGAQGSALNVATGGSTRAVENAMLPEQGATLRQPVLSPETVALDAITGAIFGQMGERVPGRMPTREQLGYRPLELAPEQPAAPRPAPQPDVDPRAAIKAVNEALYRTPEGAPAAPDLQLVPRGTDMNATSALGEPYAAPRAPDLSTSGARADLEAARRTRQQEREPERPAVIAVDSQGRAIPADENLRPSDMGTVAGLLQNDLARSHAAEVEARRAFDLAERQAERKQGAQDAGGRDLRDASAGGTTSREGTAQTTPEKFNFLDVQRDRTGNVSKTGPEVKVEKEVKVKDAQGREVPGYRVSYMRELPNGGRELVYEDVPTQRVSQLERPKGPRFAQDAAANSYAPPRGVGTGEQQPKPREAAQRITTEPSPDVIPADRAEQRGEATRTGRDVTDLAFERLENKGEAHASDVRSDQGPARIARRPDEGGAEARGNDVQRPAAGGQHADGTELRAEDEHRRQDAGASQPQPMTLKDAADFAGVKHEDAAVADQALAEHGIEPTPQNLHDVDYLSRVDPEVVERLAAQHGDDTEAFMRAVSEEVNRGKTDSGETRVAEKPSDGSGERAPNQAGTDAGGTLSANPFANPKIIAQALKWAFGDAKAWKNSSTS